MYNLLKQLDIKFTKEYSPHWASGRKYDFYIPDKNIIIEMDGGLGHGHKSFMGKITPEESKKIDKHWYHELYLACKANQYKSKKNLADAVEKIIYKKGLEQKTAAQKQAIKDKK